MLIGIAAVLYIGTITGKPQNKIQGITACLGVYAVCEILVDLRVNYVTEYVFLFIGTIAIGGIIGFLIIFVITRIKKR